MASLNTCFSHNALNLNTTLTNEQRNDQQCIAILINISDSKRNSAQVVYNHIKYLKICSYMTLKKRTIWTQSKVLWVKTRVYWFVKMDQKMGECTAT